MDLTKPFIATGIFLLSVFTAFTQSVETRALVDSVYQRLASVAAYEAQALIHVDVEFINMPDKTALISYESPDKYDVKSDGFLMIPKVGMKPMMARSAVRTVR